MGEPNPTPLLRSPTRGTGLLEPLLARLRAREANKLIPPHLRQGRILDIGCGSYPYFLSHTLFKEKYAIDQNPVTNAPQDVQWYTLDLNKHPTIRFDDEYFSTVTMLAVAEHLDPENLIALYREAYRVLEPAGRVIITTPAAWAAQLLTVMAKLRLVSKEEIDEHKFGYTLPLIGWCFGRAGFAMDKVWFGTFELGMNLWSVAEK